MEHEKQANNHISGSAMVLGLGMGLLVGVAAAIILAPQTGKETREFIKDKAADASMTVKELTKDRASVYRETWKKCREDSPFFPVNSLS